MELARTVLQALQAHPRGGGGFQIIYYKLPGWPCNRLSIRRMDDGACQRAWAVMGPGPISL